MKKTLFFAVSLLALSSAASANSLIFNYQTTGSGTESLYNPSFDGGSITAQSLIHGDHEVLQDKLTAYTKSILAPDVNVGEGVKWTLTLSFTVAEDIDIDSISLNLFTFNANGQPQNGVREGSYSFNLKLGDELLASCSNDVSYVGATGNTAGNQKADINALGKGSSGARTEANLSNSVSLTAGQTYTIELDLRNKEGNNSGYYVGLGAIELNAVPEPATASLALMGLAAFMMRRRRV